MVASGETLTNVSLDGRGSFSRQRCERPELRCGVCHCTGHDEGVPPPITVPRTRAVTRSAAVLHASDGDSVAGQGSSRQNAPASRCLAPICGAAEHRIAAAILYRLRHVIGCNQVSAGKIGNRAGQLQDTMKSPGVRERPGRGYGWWLSSRSGVCRQVSRSRRGGLRRGCRCGRGGDR